MKRQSAIAVFAGIAALALGSGALAHPRFAASTPARGSALAAAPKEVRVSFSEAVLAKGSSFTLTDAAGKAVGLGAVKLDPKDAKTLVVPVTGKLAPGAYRMRWTVAADGHTSVPGQLRFEVK